MRPPFVTVNRPERGGAHHVEALAMDVVNKLYEEAPDRWAQLCHEAVKRGLKPLKYAENLIRDLLQTAVLTKPRNENGAQS
jgi:hypothetical protein